MMRDVVDSAEDGLPPTRMSNPGDVAREVTVAFDMEATGDAKEDDGNDDSGQNRPRDSPWLVRARYAGLSALAVALSYRIDSTTATSLTLSLALVLLWISFWRVHVSNPGYLTAQMVLESEEQEGDYDNTTDVEASFDPLSPPTCTSTSCGLPTINTAGDDDTNNNNDTESTLFLGTRRRQPCPTCQLPSLLLRAHHCKVCRRCVATFDHHCHLIGNCVGEANRGRFLAFLTFQLWGFITCDRVVGPASGLSALVFPTTKDDANGGVVRYWWCEPTLVLLTKLYLYPLTTLALGMWGAHVFLACTNVTTFECVKGRNLDYLQGTEVMDLPFSQGCGANLWAIFCGGSPLWKTPRSPKPNHRLHHGWTPTVWRAPTRIIRDSEDWWKHPWQNKYWSCC